MSSQIKKKCFHDVKKELFLENKASDLVLKYSKNKKRVTVKLNNNDPFYLYHEKYTNREIMRDDTKTKWFTYLAKKIKKEIYKPSYKQSFVIKLSEGNSVDDLDLTGINIHIKKILELKSRMVFAYLTNKDMRKLKNKNVNKIEDYHTDSYVGIPEQNGYPAFFPIPIPPIPIPIRQTCDNAYLTHIGWNTSSRGGPSPSFPLVQEVNGQYNPDVVYLFILDTGISRHRFLNINSSRSRNYVPDNTGRVDTNDWFDRNGHGNHVAGIAASRRMDISDFQR